MYRNSLIVVLLVAWVFNGVAAARAPLPHCFDRPPVANAGPDQTVIPGSTVSLNGSGSSDADGDRLTFSWTLRQHPRGSAAVLHRPKSVMPYFTADVSGRYVIDLVVSDGRRSSRVDSVTVTTLESNTPPVANAGADRRVNVGDTVELDGSGSTDIDGDALQFAWTFESRPAGSLARLESAAAVRPTFVADLAGDYVVRLTVDDGRGGTASDTVVVTTLLVNRPPIADAGADQAVSAGSLVSLDAGGSTDPDGDVLTYGWSFVSRPAGSLAMLAEVNAVAPTFVADLAGDYVLQLVVSDGLVDSDPDTVLVTSNNTPPVADAGPDQEVVVGMRVQLDGNASTDANGDALSFFWSIVARPDASQVELDNALIPTPAFTGDVPGLYVLQLIVNDGLIDSPPDTVSVTVAAEPNADPVASRDEVAVDFGAAVTIDVLANDSDPDGDTLTLESVGAPVTGTAVIEGNRIRYQPAAGFTGLDIFNYTVSDGRGGSDTAGVEVRVRPAPGTVTVSVADAQAAEQGPDPGSFLISRTGPTDDPLTVHFALSGAATPGLDYQAVAPNVTIPAGAASVSIQILPVADTLAEGPEGVQLLITASPDYVVGTPSFAAISIIDSVTVTVEAPDAAASELTLDPANFVVTRSGDVSRPLIVLVSFGGAANRLNIVDATLTNIVGGVQLTIPAGASSTTITATPVRDNRVEGTEDLTLTILPANGYTVGTPATAAIFIEDDPPIVTIEASDAFASESGADPGAFLVSRTGGDLTSAISVRCAYTGSTAAPGLDFTPSGCGLTLPANAAQATLTIVPVADSRAEGSETVIVVLTESVQGAYLIGTPSQAMLTIAD